MAWKWFNDLMEKIRPASRRVLVCRLDEVTGDYHCYELIQGAYVRVSGPYHTLAECQANLEQ